MCMKVKCVGIEEEGRKNSAPSSTCARSDTELKTIEDALSQLGS